MLASLIRKYGWWVLLYLPVKWLTLGGAIYWLSRYDWFRFEYLAVLPVLVLLIFAGRRLRLRRRGPDIVGTTDRRVGS